MLKVTLIISLILNALLIRYNFFKDSDFDININITGKASFEDKKYIRKFIKKAILNNFFLNFNRKTK